MLIQVKQVDVHSLHGKEKEIKGTLFKCLVDLALEH